MEKKYKIIDDADPSCVGEEIWMTAKDAAKKNKDMDNSFYERLLIEAQELATKRNALENFLRTQKFVDLSRQNKDLLYKQSRVMSKYLQILEQRIELLGEGKKE